MIINGEYRKNKILDSRRLRVDFSMQKILIFPCFWSLSEWQNEISVPSVENVIFPVSSKKAIKFFNIKIDFSVVNLNTMNFDGTLCRCYDLQIFFSRLLN